MQTIINPNFTNKILTGATATQAGVKGVVPAPAAGDQDRVLTGAGIWRAPQHRNLIINGNFQIAQRGISFAIAGASVNGGTYTLDRWSWAAVAGGGTTASVVLSREILPAGQTEILASEAFLRITNSTQGSALGNSSYHILTQKIEDLKQFSQQTVTVSFFARSSIAAKKIACEVVSDFGVGGSPLSFLSGTTFVISSVNTWQKCTATFQMPTQAGKVYGPNHGAIVNVWLQAGANLGSRTGGNIDWQGTGTVDIANFQLEFDRQASPFEMLSLSQQLRNCQYFYQVLGVKNTNFALGRYSNFATNPISLCPAFTFPNMRTYPSVTSEADLGDITTISMSASEVTSNTVVFTQDVPPGSFLDIHWIELNAEL